MSSTRSSEPLKKVKGTPLLTFGPAGITLTGASFTPVTARGQGDGLLPTSGWSRRSGR
jgi:hypothetical protein